MTKNLKTLARILRLCEPLEIHDLQWLGSNIINVQIPARIEQLRSAGKEALPLGDGLFETPEHVLDDGFSHARIKKEEVT